ncbi:MAG TPA: hypothetical protein VE404_10325 [Verrucomicrobiae bacterium]|nr:hypothetical protein [Verrucomicrobiae bacterium]
MKKLSVTLMLGLAVIAASVAPAHAGRKSFSLDPYGFRRINGANADLGSFGTAGVKLPSGSGAEIGMGFIIPTPYRTNTPITVTVLWHAVDPNCTIELLPDFVDRSRPGHAPTAGSPSGGLTPADSSFVLVSGSVANLGNSKTFFIQSDQGFDQRSGDSILFGFARGSGQSDTCPGDLVVTGVRIEYLTP